MQVMIANVWPEAAHVEETISTLRFASRVRLIETTAHVSESYDPALMLKRYSFHLNYVERQQAWLASGQLFQSSFC